MQSFGGGRRASQKPPPRDMSTDSADSKNSKIKLLEGSHDSANLAEMLGSRQSSYNQTPERIRMKKNASKKSGLEVTPVDLKSDKTFKKLETDVKDGAKEVAKLKDTVLLMSHKLMGLMDWKISVGRDFPKLKQRVEVLYKEHEKAEQEVVAEILRPDDLQLDVDIRPAKQPAFPNLSMLVKDDSQRTIKIDDDPLRVLPEISPRARRLGPISVRHKKLPGMERFDGEKRKVAFDALSLKKRRNTLVPVNDIASQATSGRLKPKQRARLNNLIAQ